MRNSSDLNSTPLTTVLHVYEPAGKLPMKPCLVSYKAYTGLSKLLTKVT